MPFPKPPDKIVPFNSGPVAPYDIGRQFDEVRRSSAQIIDFLKTVVRDDGKLANGLVGPEQMSEDLPALLAEKAVSALTDVLADVRASASRAQASADEARRLWGAIAERGAQIAAMAAQVNAQAETAEIAVRSMRSLASAEVQPRLNDPVTPTVPTGVLGPQEADFYATDEAGSAPLASDYAQVAIAWSEHMPDTIPPNILAINAITGQHWSSRWWALQASNAFGMLTALYCGASDVPPSTTVTGDPLTPGCMYFDTQANAMQVWNGTAWVSFGQPQKGVVLTLYYQAIENQTVFPFNANDLFGKSYHIDPLDPNGVEAFVNGVRLMPDPTGDFTVGDFFLDLLTSTVTLAHPLHQGEIAFFDIIVTTSQIQPGAVAVVPLTNINTPPGTQDGSRTSFVLTVKSDGSTPVVAGAEELIVNIDGVQQEPGVQYAASDDVITFVQAPATDSYVWIVWYKTPVNNPGFVV